MKLPTLPALPQMKIVQLVLRKGNFCAFPRDCGTVIQKKVEDNDTSSYDHIQRRHEYLGLSRFLDYEVPWISDYVAYVKVCRLVSYNQGHFL